MAFASLIYSVESIANVLYENKGWRKRKRFIKFVENYVDAERFLENEIRQLEFVGKQKNKNLVFRELLNRSYFFRNDYVHHGKMLPSLSKMANHQIMAFISNDQVSVYPSYNWLRRITNLALVNFLNQETCKGKNSLSQYFQPYESIQFKTK